MTLTAVWDQYDVRLRLASDGNTFSVIGRNGNKTDIVIRSEYKNKAVTSIDFDAFFDCEDLISLTVPDSVTAVGRTAFYNCYMEKVTGLAFIFDYLRKDYLSEVTVTSGQIGGYSFYFCRKLTRVTIGSGVSSIGVNAFGCCTGLTSIVIPDNVTDIGDEAFLVATTLQA